MPLAEEVPQEEPFDGAALGFSASVFVLHGGFIGILHGFFIKSMNLMNPFQNAFI